MKRGWIYNDIVVTKTITGWWTYDENQKSTPVLTLKTKGKKEGKLPMLLHKESKKAGNGHEFSGSKFLIESIDHIKNELEVSKGQPGYNDSGLPRPKEKKVKKYLEDIEKEARNISKDYLKKKIYDWFKKQPHNKWISLSKDIIGAMTYIFGGGCGNYLYRYSPEYKKIYVFRIEGAETDEKKGKGAYIKITKDGVGEWNSVANAKEYLKENILSKMNSKEVKDELLTYKDSLDDATKEEKLAYTSGVCVMLKKLNSNVEYTNLKSDYLDLLEKKVKKYLEKNKNMSPEKAHELAVLRREDIEEKIEQSINSDKALKEMIDENPDEKIKIRIDSDDEVTVKPKNRKKYKKLSKKIEKEVTGTLTSIDDAVNDAYSKLENKVGPVFAKIIDFLIGFKKGIKKIFTGKSDFFTTAVASFLGIGGIFAGKSLIGSKKVDEAFIDKLAQMGKKTKKINYKLYFNSDVKLKDKKIIIPRGKGIKPGKKFDVKVSGKGIESADPDKKKEKKKGLFASLFSVFDGKKEYLFKNNKIEIREGTKIPKGTIIPKGAKIVRV
jgi:hypothetical protein